MNVVKKSFHTANKETKNKKESLLIYSHIFVTLTKHWISSKYLDQFKIVEIISTYESLFLKDMEKYLSHTVEGEFVRDLINLLDSREEKNILDQNFKTAFNMLKSKNNMRMLN